MPVALLALALSAFAIGTTEFVIMGLLPNVAGDLNVSIPSAGWLISGYALGVAIGAPIMAVLTAKLPRKNTLLLLMSIFIIGNVMCALSYSYDFLMLARVYLVMSCVTVKVPKAPEPLACMRRSGMISRLRLASFSISQTSCISSGPRGPAVRLFWLSTTGAPKAVVRGVLFWGSDGLLMGRPLVVG